MVHGSKISHIYISSCFGRLRQISFSNGNRKLEIAISSKLEIEEPGEIVELKSQMVGTFHWLRSKKSGRTFGRIGKKVKSQQIVGVIEALGLKHDFVSPVDGVIVEVRTRNGPIEYGQVIAIIEKKNSLI